MSTCLLLIIAGLQCCAGQADTAAAGDAVTWAALLDHAAAEDDAAGLDARESYWEIRPALLAPATVEWTLDCLERRRVRSSRRPLMSALGHASLDDTQRTRLRDLIVDDLCGVSDWSRDYGYSLASAVSQVHLLASLHPSEEEWRTVETVFVEAVSSMDHFRFPEGPFSLFDAFYTYRPESPVIPAIYARCLDEPRESREDVFLKGLEPASAEFGAYVIMYPYYVCHHGMLWAGAADFFGYENLANRGFLDAHREETFAFYWHILQTSGDQIAAFFLGHYEDQRVLEDLKRAAIAASPKATEHGWGAPLVLNPSEPLSELHCPSHTGFALAFDHILKGRFDGAVTFTERELEALWNRIETMPHAAANHDASVIGTKDGRIAISLLYAFAPMKARAYVTRAFREGGPAYRYLWKRAVPGLPLSGLPRDQLAALLGEPDHRIPATELAAWHEEHAETAEVPVDAVWKWNLTPPCGFTDFVVHRIPVHCKGEALCIAVSEHHVIGSSIHPVDHAEFWHDVRRIWAETQQKTHTHQACE